MSIVMNCVLYEIGKKIINYGIVKKYKNGGKNEEPGMKEPVPNSKFLIPD